MSHILKIHIDWSKHKDKNAIGESNTRILMKTNLIEYVNNRLTKPKDKKDLRTPSKEKNLNGEERLAKNKFIILIAYNKDM